EDGGRRCLEVVCGTGVAWSDLCVCVIWKCVFFFGDVYKEQLNVSLFDFMTPAAKKAKTRILIRSGSISCCDGYWNLTIK
ncbi:hypothetical protein D6J03_15385, partial [Legionella taurinensis]